jgi:hypothetical protein
VPSLRLRAFLRQIVTGSDATATQLRASLGIAVLDSTKVILETDSKKCAKILATVNTTFQSPNLSRTLYVYDVGRGFAAWDTSAVNERGAAVAFMDAQYKLQSLYLVPSVF